MEGKISSTAYKGTSSTYIINIPEILQEYTNVSKKIKCAHIVL